MILEAAFAPAERAEQDIIRRQHEKLAALPLIREFLDALPNMVMVLNEHRQIVFGNRAFAGFLGFKNGDFNATILGRRPGEAVGCIRSHLTAGGCGTTPFCRTCGAVIAILNSQKLHTLDVQECRLVCTQTSAGETSLDLRIWARPIEVGDEVFTVFSVVDISDEKRLKALERIFFHDVINTAGCIKGLSDLMFQMEMSETEIKEISGMISESSEQLLEEINAQRALSAAESGDLKPEAMKIKSLDLLSQIVRQIRSHSVAMDKHIEVVPTAARFDFVSDPVLLRRVLLNLAKNALEASKAGETVMLDALVDDTSVCFTVHNPAVMPPEVRLQIFARSFSTKGNGRGLGTYSIKLISEKYLHGHVSFISNANEGTRFTVRYPRVVESPKVQPPR